MFHDTEIYIYITLLFELISLIRMRKYIYGKNYLYLIISIHVTDAFLQ